MAQHQYMYFFNKVGSINFNILFYRITCTKFSHSVSHANTTSAKTNLIIYLHVLIRQCISSSWTSTAVSVKLSLYNMFILSKKEGEILEEKITILSINFTSTVKKFVFTILA